MDLNNCAKDLIRSGQKGTSVYSALPMSCRLFYYVNFFRDVEKVSFFISSCGYFSVCFDYFIGNNCSARFL